MRYEISDRDSYSGTSSVIDLVGSSNSTLYYGPTYSINGYLNFDGSNDYLFTNTSLNSKLSPNSSSNTISCFLWVYPMSNGVILTEQGTNSGGSLDGDWYDSQVEIVSGTLNFRVWPGSGISSNLNISNYNWYYMGFSYNGITNILSCYVNGQLVASTSISRQAPNPSYGLFYAISSNTFTNMGSNSYAKMKLGAFHVYNTALSQQQVINNYNSTKSNYIVTASMSIWIDANDPESYPGSGTTITDLSGNNNTHSLISGAVYKNLYGVQCFDCSGNLNQIDCSATGPLLQSSGYTYVSWARMISSSATFRTLFRTDPADHPLLINTGSDILGMWDNNGTDFNTSTYSVASLANKWVQWSVVGDSNGSTFYINGEQVGTAPRSASGNYHNIIGNSVGGGQPFGYVGNNMLYNKKLTQAEIKQNYDALKHVYEGSNFVTSNLTLCLLPSSATNSSTWSDSQGNLNATMSGSPSYNNLGYTFNGTTQYGRINSSAGVTDFTNADSYTVEVWFNPSSGQPSSSLATILEKWNQNNQSRYPFVLRFNESTSTSYFACYDGVNNPVVNITGITTNLWYQLVGVYDFATDVLTTYKNGVLFSTTSLSGVGQVSNTSQVGIAHRITTAGGTQFMLKGSIGIIRIYNSVLSASDVSTNFEANRAIYGI